MAHPKRRQSNTRTAKRRTHDKAVAPTLAVCPNCGAYYVYHTVCPTCGYYRGKVAIVKDEVGKYMTKGSHGSTFGGNALCCCAGNACMDEILKPDFMKHVVTVGEFFDAKLKKLCKKYPKVFTKVSGKGLMIGLSVDEKYAAGDLAKELLKNGLSCCTAGGNQIRFLPPLIITKGHVSKAIKIIEKVAKQLNVVK